jgi:M6 family metalloprotease-like protein
VQPDGVSVTVSVHGSARSLYFKDAHGFPALLQNGWLVYAQPDEEGILQPSGLLLGHEDPQEHSLQPLSGLPAIPPPRAGTVSPGQRLHPRIQSASAAPAKHNGSNLPHASAATTGTVDNLVLLLRFSDHGPGGQNRTLPPDADVSTIMNAVGGDPVLAPTGSVRDAYLEYSYNQLTLDSVVVGWLDVPNTEVYYANNNSGLTSLTWDLITDGLNLADPLVDFSQFDDDNDGVIDSITFLHSGYGAEWVSTDQYGTSYFDRMWSHRWSIPTWTSAEGVTVSDYHISPGLWGVSGSEPGHIGVVVHETGHFFGIPDLYDTNGNGQGIGNWDVMAAGSWGFDGSQQNPTHMSAWTKMNLGWMQPQLLGPGTGLVLQELANHPEAFLIQNGYPQGEYLLLEYRNQVGFDAAIPQPGLLVWHVDETKGILGFNNVNADEGYPGQSGWPSNNNHYRLALLQADGGYDMEMNFDRGDSADPYHDGGVDQINDSTTPSLESYQGGSITSAGNDLNDITENGSSGSFDYDNALTPEITPGTLPAAVVGVPYQLQISALSGAAPQEFRELLDNPQYTESDLGSNQFSGGGSGQGWHADDDLWSLALPFDFPFYDGLYSTVYVSSNGFLDFAPVEADPANHENYMRFARRIAPLWEDLRTDGSGQDIFVDTGTPGQVRIRWDAETFDNGDPCNFRVVLFQNGDLRFDYGSGNTGIEATVGISSGTGPGDVLLSQYDMATDLGNEDSVEFQFSGSQLPAGLQLSSSGLVSGTPTQSGSSNFSTQRTDTALRFDRESFSLQVDAASPGSPTLASYPQTSRAGDTQTLRTSGGSALNPALLFLTHVNGTPFFRYIIGGVFDSFGVWHLAGPVPVEPNLPGSTLTFTVFEVAPGAFIPSNSLTLAFQ